MITNLLVGIIKLLLAIAIIVLLCFAIANNAWRMNAKLKKVTKQIAQALSVRLDEIGRDSVHYLTVRTSTIGTDCLEVHYSDETSKRETYEIVYFNNLLGLDKETKIQIKGPDKKFKYLARTIIGECNLHGWEAIDFYDRYTAYDNEYYVSSTTNGNVKVERTASDHFSHYILIGRSEDMIRKHGRKFYKPLYHSKKNIVL